MLILICWTGYLSLRLGLNWIVGTALKGVFASGTGCEVVVHSPFLEFFPLRASVERVSIRHPKEPQTQGFTADHVEIGLAFLPLFHGEVRLQGLLIRGAQAISIGADTGFLKTMAFLFPPEPETAPPPPGFFGRQLQKLVVHLTDIRIPALPSEESQLVLGEKDNYFQATKVDLTFIEQDADSKKPFDLVASVEHGQFVHEPLRPSQFGKVYLSGALGLGRLAITEARLQARSDPNSRLEVGGQMGITMKGSYALEVQGNLSERALDEMFPPSSIGHPEQIQLKTKVSGKLDMPELEGAIAVQPGRSFLPMLTVECKPETFSAQFRYSPEAVSLSEIFASKFIEKGTVTFASQSNDVDVDLPLTLSGSSLFRDCAASYKQGSVEFLKVLQNSKGRIQLKGRTEPQDLEAILLLDVVSENSSHLESHVHLTPGKIHAHVVETVLHGGDAAKERLLLDAEYEPEHSSLKIDQFQAKDFPVESLFRYSLPFLPREQGEKWSQFITAQTKIQAQAQLKAQLETKEFSGGGTISLLSVALPGGRSIPKLTIPFQANNELVQASLEKLSVEGGSIGGDVQYKPKEGVVKGGVVVSALNLKALSSSLKDVPPQMQYLDAKADIQGPVKEAKVVLNARLGNAAQQPLFLLTGGGSLRALDVHIAESSGAGEADLRFETRQNGKPFLRASANLKELRWERLFGAAAPEVRGRVIGRFQYESPLGDPLAGKGSLDLPEFSLGNDKIMIRQQGPLRMNLENGRLEFSQVVLSVGERPFSITGSISQKQGWQVDIGGRWVLSALPHSVDVIIQLAGELGVKVNVRGELADPQLFGNVEVADGGFVLPLGQDALVFRKVAVQGSFDKNTFTLRSFQGNTPGGVVNAHGVVHDVLDAEKRVIDMQANLKRVRVQPVENLQLALSGDLRVEQHPHALPAVSGMIHIDRASYEKTIDLIQILQQLTGFITGRQRRSPSNAEGGSREAAATFNLQIQAENDLIVETNIVRAELAALLQLTGDTAAPLLDGDINLLEGEFGSRSNTFAITSGRAHFSASQGNLDPTISLVAETSALTTAGQEQLIRMFLSGTLTKPKVEFASEGGLRQEEIIALLGLRTNLQTVRLLGKEKEQRSLVDLINPVSGATLEDRISGITGFSEVQVDTAISGATGEVVPRLVAKRPLAGRLSLDAISELSGQQLSILNLSYPLNMFLNVIAGFRTIPPSGSQANGSGSFYLGVRHRSTFPGTSFFPKDLTTTQIPARTGVDNNFGLPRR